MTISSHPKKPCALCSLDIPVTAKICTNCNSEQRAWIRYAKTCALAGAGLVALIPLFQAASSLNDLATGRHKAEVTVKAVECGKAGITAIAMNFGKGPAFISLEDFSISGLSNPDIKAITLKSDSPIDPVGPGAYKKMTFKGWMSTVQSNLPTRGNEASCTFNLRLNVIDAYAETQKTVSCECPLS